MSYEGYFTGGDISKQMRERIAQMLFSNRRSQFPKNLGEGLTAIGDALGDRGMMSALMAAEKKAKEEADRSYTAAGGEVSGAPAAPSRARALASDEQPDVIPAPPVTPTQPPPDLVNTPRQPASMLSPTMPGGLQPSAPSNREQISALLSGQPMASIPRPASLAAASPQDGGYNILDAQAGLNPIAPLRPGVMDAIQRNVTDPNRQAYLARLSAREQPPSGPATSPTGAAGPYQFTAGTGADYGLPTRAAREDLDLSTQAADQLTSDRAAQFQRRFGREPTNAELAVMHQQGAAGGMGLIAGRPVSAYNAQVNRLPVGNAPAQLAAINNFYGMTPRAQDTEMSSLSRSVTPGANITRTIPPPAPQGTMTGVPMPQSGFAPVPSGQQIPRGGTQIAQAPQAATQGIRPIPQGPPPQTPFPQMLPPSARESALRDAYLKYKDDPNYARHGAEAARLEAERKAQHEMAVKNWEVTRAREEKIAEEYRKSQTPEAQAALTKAQAEAKGAQQYAVIQERLGGQKPEEFFKKMDAEKPEIRADKQYLDNAEMGLRALDGGAITGVGSTVKINWERAKQIFGADNKKLVSTEQLESAMLSAVGRAVRALQGGSAANVGKTDIELGRDYVGRPGMQPETIRSLLNMHTKQATRRIDDFERRQDQYLSGTKAWDEYQIDAGPQRDEKTLKKFLENQNDPRHVRSFNYNFGEGTAQLEINRARRALERERAREREKYRSD